MFELLLPDAGMISVVGPHGIKHFDAVMSDESVKGIRNRELARFPRISLCSNKFSWSGLKKER
jgi:hypothetical protein